ncbi:MAG: hypothetical protein OXD43_00915 [Bacteroidetes bacterium]|nr:hypothetical protein [Bacteroidota bacterium]
MSDNKMSTYAQQIKSRIDGTFVGWSGETIVKLVNGQIWQQAEFWYRYHYAYMPEVIISPTGGGHTMQVNGVPRPVSVIRLK